MQLPASTSKDQLIVITGAANTVAPVMCVPFAIVIWVADLWIPVTSSFENDNNVGQSSEPSTRGGVIPHVDSVIV